MKRYILLAAIVLVLFALLGLGWLSWHRGADGDRPARDAVSERRKRYQADDGSGPRTPRSTNSRGVGRPG